eukprot:13325230-Ditylum_brightwellii.AAC.1
MTTQEQNKRKELRGQVPRKSQQTKRNSEFINAIGRMESVIQNLQEKGAENMPTSKGDEKDEKESPRKLRQDNQASKVADEHLNKERKRNQREISKHPAVVISHPTHHNNTHQDGPNSGSEGEECPEME